MFESLSDRLQNVFDPFDGLIAVRGLHLRDMDDTRYSQSKIHNRTRQGSFHHRTGKVHFWLYFISTVIGRHNARFHSVTLPKSNIKRRKIIPCPG